MATGTIKRQNSEFHSFTKSDPNINLLNNPRCIRCGNVVNVSFAVRYSTVNTSDTEITDYTFPYSASMQGLAIHGLSTIEDDTGSVPELTLQIYNGRLKARGGQAEKVYLCNFSYIIW